MGLNEAQKKERSEYLEHNLNITECSQRKPYVFISYASDNWERVFKNAVVPMQKQYGLRVYADKAFDTVNDKWIVPMLRNIRGADVIIAFVSQNYIESYACFLELLTAVNNKKQIVFVSLEDQLHLGDTTDQPVIERGVKNEILNQGANIATNTNNTSNDIMRAMKSAYTSISTLLEQDALSKYDISDAFINFFRDASINRKTINDLGAVKGTIESVSGSVFDKAIITEPVHKVNPAAPVRQTAPIQQPAPAQRPVQQNVPVGQPMQQSAPAQRPVQQNVPVGQPMQQSAPAQRPVQQNAPVRQPMQQSAPAQRPMQQNAPVRQPMQQSAPAQQQGQQNAPPPMRNQMPPNQYAPQYVPAYQKPVSPDNIKTLFFEKLNIDPHSPNFKKLIVAVAIVCCLIVAVCVIGAGAGKNVKNMSYTSSTGATGTYTGKLKHGEPNGKGNMKWSNGNVYDGEWVNGKANGQGTCTWSDDGRTYSGEWVNDFPEGYGTMTYTDKSYYTGIWEKGSFTNGNVKSSNGDSYSGDWGNGVPNGYGTYKWADNRTYTGEWKNGFCCGNGTMTYANGDKYAGEWENGLYNGAGTYTDANGNVWNGKWQDGKFVE